MKRALEGMAEMKKACDTLIAIPTQNLMSIVDKNTTLPEAFQMADTILHQAAKGISDLINVQGVINLDFADVETIMKNQNSINTKGDVVEIVGKGRHDPCVVPRAVPIVESMAALVLADFQLRNNNSKI